MSQQEGGSSFWGDVLGSIPFVGDILGGMIERGQSKRDIERQNEYNHPKNQLARLREAGLPMAAMGGGNLAGSQSNLPLTSNYGAKGSQAIAQYYSSQMAQKQLAILKEEIRLKRSEADLNEANRDIMLGIGESRQGTTLERSLRAKVGLEEFQTEGAKISNQIQSLVKDNTKTRLMIENEKGMQEIKNFIANRGLISKHIEGAELDNKVKEVISKYQEGMSSQGLIKLMKEVNLLDENIQGKNLENQINEVKLRIEKATEAAQIYEKDLHAAIAGLTYDKVKEEFENYKQYQRFVQIVQDEVSRTPWERITDPIGTLKSIASWVYTMTTSPTGQGTTGGSIINSLPK